MDDEVWIAAGASYWYHNWDEKQLLAPLPPPPEFSVPLETVRERIAKVVGHVTVPHKIQTWHPAIDRLLKEDERRREKQLRDPYPSSWDNPLFDTPLERRRLHLLNSLFFATAKLNGKPAIYGREGREIQIVFYQQRVGIRLERPKNSKRPAPVSGSASASRDSCLCLSILDSPNSEKTRASWQDGEAKLETQMTEVAIQVVLTAEIEYRESAIRQYQWRVQRKADLEEQQRQRKIEAERAERERQKRIEQARIDRLLRDAAAFHQAEEIRKYVAAIRSALDERTYSAEEFERWRRWALAEADRIDPTVGGAFLKAMRDEEDGKI
jgi:hypothetical protein